METKLRIHSPLPAESVEKLSPIHFSAASIRCFQNQRDRIAQPLPPRGFSIQLLLSRFGQTIVLGLASALGCFPIGLQPTSVPQPVKRGIKRSLPNLQRVLRILLE